MAVVAVKAEEDIRGQIQDEHEVPGESPLDHGSPPRRNVPEKTCTFGAVEWTGGRV